MTVLKHDLKILWYSSHHLIKKWSLCHLPLNLVTGWPTQYGRCDIVSVFGCGLSHIGSFHFLFLKMLPLGTQQPCSEEAKPTPQKGPCGEEPASSMYESHLGNKSLSPSWMTQLMSHGADMSYACWALLKMIYEKTNDYCYFKHLPFEKWLYMDNGSKVHFRWEEGEMSGLIYNSFVISSIYNINHSNHKND